MCIMHTSTNTSTNTNTNTNTKKTQLAEALGHACRARASYSIVCYSILNILDYYSHYTIVV